MNFNLLASSMFSTTIVPRGGGHCSNYVACESFIVNRECYIYHSRSWLSPHFMHNCFVKSRVILPNALVVELGIDTLFLLGIFRQ